VYLPQPSYFPPARGRYTVTPDLKPLGTDFGNGHFDKVAFQFDEHTPRYLANKAGRVALTDSFAEIEEAVVAALATRLTADWPELSFDLTDFNSLCRQVPEDIAIVRSTPERGDWNAALFVACPSHWAPEEKLGKSFLHTHQPVPGMAPTLAVAPTLVERICTHGPFVRFAWGLHFDDRLDCHPRHPKAVFDGEHLWLRAERQVLLPLPSLSAAAFLIRVHLYPVEGLPLAPLLAALESMSPEARIYKGLAPDWDKIKQRLRRSEASVGEM